MSTPSVEIILYVRSQQVSAEFYRALLRREPTLDVPGMTQFALGEGVVLGLMPAEGIARILGDALPHPATAAGVPRCELYLVGSDADTAHAHALAVGATPVSAVADRDWGDRAGYVADPDGHVIAFAQRDH